MKKKYIVVMICLLLLFLIFGNTATEDTAENDNFSQADHISTETEADGYSEADSDEYRESDGDKYLEAAGEEYRDTADGGNSDTATTDSELAEIDSDENNKNSEAGETIIAESTDTAADEGEAKTYKKAVLKTLENTDIFIGSAIEHIFEGNVKRGSAGGYHYECIEDTAGKVIEGTEVSLNDLGVYKAKVEVDGIAKTSNKGYSTFFPKYMDPQEVVDAINEAYDDKVFVEGTSNTYRGYAQNGLLIEMYINEKGKIISAFPKE